MALREDGHVAGSVSGGCIEGNLILRAREDEALRVPQIISYGVNADEARRFGLLCGGAWRRSR